MGFEPHSVVSSALKPASPTPTEGASPLVRSPRRGHTPFEIPHAVGSNPRRACCLRFTFHAQRGTVFWSGRWDLNPRQLAWEARTLPLSYARPGFDEDE
jgi:hypothetical protein